MYPVYRDRGPAGVSAQASAHRSTVTVTHRDGAGPTSPCRVAAAMTRDSDNHSGPGWHCTTT
jgi:hypothetical protein